MVFVFFRSQSISIVIACSIRRRGILRISGIRWRLGIPVAKSSQNRKSNRAISLVFAVEVNGKADEQNYNDFNKNRAKDQPGLGVWVLVAEKVSV
jgi:hypothetical protein